MCSNISSLKQITLTWSVSEPVLATGAWLKNSACLVDGATAWLSPDHGDLSTPEACEALRASLAALLAISSAPPRCIAHDLHPNFFSTQLAIDLARTAEKLKPSCESIAVQHHVAHIASVLAEQGLDAPVVGLALDGVGLGVDEKDKNGQNTGSAWGGELLYLNGKDWQRLAHLSPLALAGGDVAARESWRVGAAALFAMGKGDEIAKRFVKSNRTNEYSKAVNKAVNDSVMAGVDEQACRVVLQMLQKNLNCPRSTSAGRWFDAIAALCGLNYKQSFEAEAAIALERSATRYLQSLSETERLQFEDQIASDISADISADFTADVSKSTHATDVLDMLPVMQRLLQILDCGDRADGKNKLPAQEQQSQEKTQEQRQEQAAAYFHLALAQKLVLAAILAAKEKNTSYVVLSGGCFFNTILREAVISGLQAKGLQVLRNAEVSCGDAGLALGQAWWAAQQAGILNNLRSDSFHNFQETEICV